MSPCSRLRLSSPVALAAIKSFQSKPSQAKNVSQSINGSVNESVSQAINQSINSRSSSRSRSRKGGEPQSSRVQLLTTDKPSQSKHLCYFLFFCSSPSLLLLSLASHGDVPNLQARLTGRICRPPLARRVSHRSFPCGGGRVCGGSEHRRALTTDGQRKTDRKRKLHTAHSSPTPRFSQPAQSRSVMAFSTALESLTAKALPALSTMKAPAKFQATSPAMTPFSLRYL